MQTKSGHCYVFEKFEFNERGLAVLKGNEHAGSYDKDGKKDPDPPYAVPLDQIVSFESTRYNWGKFAAITLTAAGVVIALLAIALINGY